MNMLKNKFFSLILFFIITFSASFIGGLTSISFKEPWYSQLIKSDFNPPDWIFAPVWTTLYLMMTLAIWFFWHSKNRDTNTVYIYFIHIVFNTTWSIVFFGLHQILKWRFPGSEERSSRVGLTVDFPLWLPDPPYDQ